MALAVASTLLAGAGLGIHFTEILERVPLDQPQAIRTIENKLTQAYPFAEGLVLQLESEDRRQVVVNRKAAVAAETALQADGSRTAATRVVSETEIGAMSGKVVVIIVHPADSNNLGDDLFFENREVAASREQAHLAQHELSAGFD